MYKMISSPAVLLAAVVLSAVSTLGAPVRAPATGAMMVVARDGPDIEARHVDIQLPGKRAMKIGRRYPQPGSSSNTARDTPPLPLEARKFPHRHSHEVHRQRSSDRSKVARDVMSDLEARNKRADPRTVSTIPRSPSTGPTPVKKRQCAPKALKKKKRCTCGGGSSGGTSGLTSSSSAGSPPLTGDSSTADSGATPTGSTADPSSGATSPGSGDSNSSGSPNDGSAPSNADSAASSSPTDGSSQTDPTSSSATDDTSSLSDSSDSSDGSSDTSSDGTQTDPTSSSATDDTSSPSDSSDSSDGSSDTSSDGSGDGASASPSPSADASSNPSLSSRRLIRRTFSHRPRRLNMA